jgi:aspartate/methionine/tyrosine aminotransferase
MISPSFDPQPQPELQISRRVNDIPEALSIYINQLVYDLRRKGQNVTVLSLGEAYFDVPWFGFDDLDVKKCNHYSDSRGIPELRGKLSEFYGKEYGAPVDPEREIIVTAGSKFAIFMAMQTILNPGDEVAIQEPAWLSYQEQVRLVDAIPKFIPYDEPLDHFWRTFTPKTKMLILNNPNNPAGRTYTRGEVVGLYEQCRSNGVYLLVDEAYSDFLMDEPFHSLAAIAPEKHGAIVVNSLSKNMGISGWRIGYLIGAGNFVDQCLKVNQHLITCAPTILLHYLARHFDTITSVTLPQARATAHKRARIERALDRFNLQRMAGSGTFYFFISIEDYPGSSLDFALALLLEDGIAVVPGSAYGDSTQRFIRISIGTEPEERISDALEAIRGRISAKSLNMTHLRKLVRDAGFKQFRGREPRDS